MVESANYSTENLASLLSAVVGDEKAEDAIHEATRALCLRPGRAMTRVEALAVLEKVAEAGGVLGVTARFAKSRLHLAR